MVVVEVKAEVAVAAAARVPGLDMALELDKLELDMAPELEIVVPEQVAIKDHQANSDHHNGLSIDS